MHDKDAIHFAEYDMLNLERDALKKSMKNVYSSTKERIRRWTQAANVQGFPNAALDVYPAATRSRDVPILPHLVVWPRIKKTLSGHRLIHHKNERNSDSEVHEKTDLDWVISNIFSLIQNDNWAFKVAPCVAQYETLSENPIQISNSKILKFEMRAQVSSR